MNKKERERELIFGKLFQCRSISDLSVVIVKSFVAFVYTFICISRPTVLVADTFQSRAHHDLRVPRRTTNDIASRLERT